jgi:putative membrane protein insertion efficiency factor
MKRLIVLLVRFYQTTLRHIMPSTCRFTPTCSEYFIEAVEKRGAFKGSLLGIGRVLRCNPFSKGGYDPVDK